MEAAMFYTAGMFGVFFISGILAAVIDLLF